MPDDGAAEPSGCSDGSADDSFEETLSEPSAEEQPSSLPEACVQAEAPSSPRSPNSSEQYDPVLEEGEELHGGAPDHQVQDPVGAETPRSPHSLEQDHLGLEDGEKLHGVDPEHRLQDHQGGLVAEELEEQRERKSLKGTDLTTLSIAGMIFVCSLLWEAAAVHSMRKATMACAVTAQVIILSYPAEVNCHPFHTYLIAVLPRPLGSWAGNCHHLLQSLYHPFGTTASKQTLTLCSCLQHWKGFSQRGLHSTEDQIPRKLRQPGG